MLTDEPDIPLYQDQQSKGGGVEESKFDDSEANDRNFLTKKYPGLAIPNKAIVNKEEIDILGDLNLEDKKEDTKPPSSKKLARHDSRSRSP